jgi:hypothetical protein
MDKTKEMGKRAGRVKYPELADREWLERRYCTEGRSTLEIASELGCVPETVCNALRRHGISARDPMAWRAHPALADKNWLEHQYSTLGRTTLEIAGDIGCGDAAVSKALQRHGIEARASAPAVVFPGDKFGHLVVVGEVGIKRRRRAYLCRCRCGGEVVVTSNALRVGNTRSCGCYHREQAGLRRKAVAATNDAAVRDAVVAGRRFSIRRLTSELELSRETVKKRVHGLERRGAVSRTPTGWEYVKPAGTIKASSEKSISVPGWKRAGGSTGRTDLPADKEMRRLAQRAMASGATVTRTGGDHFAVKLPNGATVMLPGTPSGSRTAANKAAELARALTQ